MILNVIFNCQNILAKSSICQKNPSLHSPNRSSGWGTKKVQKLNHRVHSTSLPRHGGQRHDTKTSTNLAFIWHAKCPKKKQLLILRNLKSRRFKKQFFTGWMSFSVCLGIFALFGVSGTPRLSWIDQNVQWPATRYSSIFKASKRRLVCGTPVVVLTNGILFWDGNQTVRNEMLLTVLKIVLKFSSKN